MGLSDIFPVRSIYLGSGFAVLVWTLPYAFGVTVHHFLTRHWIRGTAWTLFILLIPSFMLARVFAWGLEEDLYTPRTILMGITCVVALGQAILWRLLWNEYRLRGEISPWRTIANSAFIASIVISLLSVGCFYLEERHNYLEGIRVHQQAEVEQEHLAAAGYHPYPGAIYPFGEYMVRSTGVQDLGSGAGYEPDVCCESLAIHFRTGDESREVLDYYRRLAIAGGFRVRDGISRSSGEPMMIAVGRDVAMIVESLSGGEGFSARDWMVTAYWDVPDSFEDRIGLNFEMDEE